MLPHGQRLVVEVALRKKVANRFVMKGLKKEVDNVLKELREAREAVEKEMEEGKIDERVGRPFIEKVDELIAEGEEVKKKSNVGAVSTYVAKVLTFLAQYGVEVDPVELLAGKEAKKKGEKKMKKAVEVESAEELLKLLEEDGGDAES